MMTDFGPTPEERLAAAFRAATARRRGRRSRPSWSAGSTTSSPVPSRSHGGAPWSCRRIAPRPAARRVRAGGLHGDDATDPQPRRDDHQGVTARGPVCRSDAASDAPALLRPGRAGWARSPWRRFSNAMSAAGIAVSDRAARAQASTGSPTSLPAKRVIYLFQSARLRNWTCSIPSRGSIDCKAPSCRTRSGWDSG